MTKLAWNTTGNRKYEVGVDRGVLFTSRDNGVPWNGLVSVSESPSGGEAVPYYMDGVKYLNVASPEEFGATIEAFTYPDEFAACDGTIVEDGLGYSMQERKPFDLTYRTLVGNDVQGQDHGYKIHFIYNAMASPTEKAYTTVADSPETLTFSWEISTTPEFVFNKRPTAHMFIDSTKTTLYRMNELEGILYGTEDTDPRFPSPVELAELFGHEIFEVLSSENDGLATLLINEVNRDLSGPVESGTYRKTNTSSLTETSIPGLFIQEQ